MTSCTSRISACAARGYNLRMDPTRYSARVGEAHCIGAGLSYDALVALIIVFTLRAAFARSADQSEWEHEIVRRKGLAAVQLFRDGKAIWDDPGTFAEELAEAEREHIADRFQAQNELDPAFYEGLDGDLRARWRELGYLTPSLRTNMKTLFLELERDVSEQEADARGRMLKRLIERLKRDPSRHGTA